jgi:hypothetical protein
MKTAERSERASTFAERQCRQSRLKGDENVRCYLDFCLWFDTTHPFSVVDAKSKGTDASEAFGIKTTVIWEDDAEKSTPFRPILPGRGWLFNR